MQTWSCENECIKIPHNLHYVVNLKIKIKFLYIIIAKFMLKVNETQGIIKKYIKLYENDKK